MDVEELDFAELTPAILAAPAPTVDGKTTMIAHGWMEVASNDLKVSNCSQDKSPVFYCNLY